MKKIIIVLLYTGVFFILTNCGETSKEGTGTDTTQTTGDSSKTTESDAKTTTENPVANKEFSFGLNQKNCDGLTYSEYGATLKFGADNTVEQVMTSVGNMGSPEVFEIKITSKGTYAMKNEVLTIDFTEKKEEHIRDNKAFKTETKEPQDLNLKMSKCEDGRLQLMSNVEGKNAMGDEGGENDQSSWSLKKEKQ